MPSSGRPDSRLGFPPLPTWPHIREEISLAPLRLENRGESRPRCRRASRFRTAAAERDSQLPSLPSRSSLSDRCPLRPLPVRRPPRGGGKNRASPRWSRFASGPAIIAGRASRAGERRTGRGQQRSAPSSRRDHDGSSPRSRAPPRPDSGRRRPELEVCQQVCHSGRFRGFPASPGRRAKRGANSGGHLWQMGPPGFEPGSNGL